MNDLSTDPKTEVKPGKFNVTLHFIHLILLHQSEECLQVIIKKIGENNVKNAFKQLVNVTPVKGTFLKKSHFCQFS